MTDTANGNGCSSSRRAIHAPICADSAEQLRGFCSEHGVTVTAYLDAVGHLLGTLRGISTDKLAEITPLFEPLLHHARKIDAARRARS